MKVLRGVCDVQHATLHEMSPVNDVKLTQALPLFQRRNWSLAKAVYGFVAERDRLPSLTPAKLAGTMAIRIPARMEVVSYNGKIIIIDGAHNPQKLRALLASIRHSYPSQSMAVLVGFVRSRKPRLHGNLRELLTSNNYLIATSFVPNQEMYTQSASPLDIARFCRQQGFKNVETEPDPKKAFIKLIKRPEPILLVTGSFYLLHHIRPLILNNDD